MKREHARWFVYWLLSTDPRPFMVVLGFWTAAWGLWLAIPWAITFTNPIYDAVRFLASESVWGIVLFVVGVGKIYHAFRPIGSAALIITFIATFLWVFIFIAFMISAPHTTAIPVYGQVVVYNAWLLYRIQGALLDGRAHDQ